jgi:hypothetical protein
VTCRAPFLKQHGVPMPSLPREVLAHSQFDEETREILLLVYDNIHKEFQLDDTMAAAVVDRILTLAAGGERSPDIIEKAAQPAGQAGLS